MDQSKGVEQLTLLIDFKDYSLFNAPPMWQSKEVLHIITSCYPERLGLALLVDAPWIFKTFFKVSLLHAFKSIPGPSLILS